VTHVGVLALTFAVTEVVPDVTTHDGFAVAANVDVKATVTRPGENEVGGVVDPRGVSRLRFPKGIVSDSLPGLS
jgi:hypothetical protein